MGTVTDLRRLPRLRDSWSYLCAEHCRVEQLERIVKDVDHVLAAGEQVSGSDREAAVTSAAATVEGRKEDR